MHRVVDGVDSLAHFNTNIREAGQFYIDQCKADVQQKYAWRSPGFAVVF